MFDLIINKKNELKLEGKPEIRVAIRAIITKLDTILLVYSKENGDYKFPGGGVEENETFEETLKREVLEESGYHVNKIIKKIGVVDEYDLPMNNKYDYFNMISHYYSCSVFKNRSKQDLDNYEEELGFTPVWVKLSDAIEANNRVLSSNELSPPWTKRETSVLEYILLNKDLNIPI